MKKLFALILFSIVLSGCDAKEESNQSSNSLIQAPPPSYQIDQAATANTPWQVGEAVAIAGTSLPGEHAYPKYLNIEKRFLGVTVDGYYLIQVFYKDGGSKYTDPFVVTQKEAVTEGHYQRNVQGPIKGWYPSGKKLYAGAMNNGKWQGTLTRWFETGDKESESQRSDDGVMKIITVWHPNGQKKEEVRFGDNKNIEITQWDTEGNALEKRN